MTERFEMCARTLHFKHGTNLERHTSTLSSAHVLYGGDAREDKGIGDDGGENSRFGITHSLGGQPAPQFPVGMMPPVSTINITVRCGARGRCMTPLGITVACRGPSSKLRSSRSMNNRPSTT